MGHGSRPAVRREKVEAEVRVIPTDHCIEITTGPAVTQKGSTFQAHVARVRDEREARAVRCRLLAERKKLGSAKHNVLAFRVGGGGATVHSGYDDNGEAGGGAGLLRLLEAAGATDVVVVVSRWFLGTNIGADRFRNMSLVASTLLAETGITSSGSSASSSSDGSDDDSKQRKADKKKPKKNSKQRR